MSTGCCAIYTRSFLARDGSSYFVEQGRLVSLLPLLPGEMADGDQVCLVAADFLARFHRVGVGYPDRSPRPDVPAWREWDWCAAEWSQIEEALGSTPAATSTVGQRFWQACGAWASEISERRAQIRAERDHCQQWIADLTRWTRPLTVGPVHDDYHDNNLLVDEAQVTALLDWDGCHPDWLLWDVSNALWEFCHDDETHALVVKDAQDFLWAYTAAGGPVTAAEYELIIPFIRCRRMIEVLGSLHGIVTGGAWDESPDYLVHNLIALENLRGIRL
jgi:Ser/Thr protein kinase RdoA (MazF antagonist)